MRQCIFVIGTRAQLLELSPLLQVARQAGLRYSIWVTAERSDPVDTLLEDTGVTRSVVLPARSAPRSLLAKILYWLPVTAYRCYNYVHGVRLWTGKSPLVVLDGNSLSTGLARVAGRWGGGQLVHLQHTAGALPATRRTMRKTRFAFCSKDLAPERARRYPGCTVVGVEPGDAGDLQLIVESLLRWTGGRRDDD